MAEYFHRYISIQNLCNELIHVFSLIYNIMNYNSAFDPQAQEWASTPAWIEPVKSASSTPTPTPTSLSSVTWLVTRTCWRAPRGSCGTPTVTPAPPPSPTQVLPPATDSWQDLTLDKLTDLTKIGLHTWTFTDTYLWTWHWDSMGINNLCELLGWFVVINKMHNVISLFFSFCKYFLKYQ